MSKAALNMRCTHVCSSARAGGRVGTDLIIITRGLASTCATQPLCLRPLVQAHVHLQERRCSAGLHTASLLSHISLQIEETCQG